MTDFKYKGKHSVCIHEGQIEETQFGGSVSPLYMATSYAYIDEDKKRYPRYFNTPNQEAVAAKIARLEQAETGLIFSSGMAAISTTLLAFLKKGDHLVIQNEVYGGSFNLVCQEFENYGISYTFTDGLELDDFEKEIRPNTKVIYIESPSNPLLSLVDLRGISKMARKNKIISVIDNTFASPINQTPIDFGIDLVVHSATKYLSGHSDISAGAVMGSSKLMLPVMKKARNLGGNLSEWMSYLLERSIKTLALRIEKHNYNAMYVAQKLNSSEEVVKVFYPGLTTHRNHELANEQMNGYGGMLSFEVGQHVEVKTFLLNLKMIKPSMSLAGVETTIIQPSLTSHALMSAKERQKQGISDNLLRLSVGLENQEDIINDINQALNSAIC